MAPTVSIVVATYNYGKYIRESLDSALAQSYQDIEVVVIDDGSTDGTDTIMQEYATNDKVRYYRTDHLGQSAAKNHGIQQAQGKYLAFLDSDDRWLPTKLEKQIERFEADPELGVVYTRRYWIDSEGERMARQEPRLYRGSVLAEIFRDNFICFASSMVRRSVLDDVGIFDESIPLAIDYELWLRVSAKYRIDYVDEPLVEYRTGHANLSQRGEERLQIALRIMTRFLEERSGKELLSPHHVKLCFAETYEHLALTQKPRSRFVAFGTYLTSIMYLPTHGPAWLGAMKLIIPDQIATLLRSIKHRLSF